MPFNPLSPKVAPCNLNGLQATSLEVPGYSTHHLLFPTHLLWFSPAWWLWRSGHARSHLELDLISLHRQLYFIIRRGRVDRCQACERQEMQPKNFRRIDQKTLHSQHFIKTRRSRNGRRVWCFVLLVLILAFVPSVKSRSTPDRRQAHAHSRGASTPWDQTCFQAATHRPVDPVVDERLTQLSAQKTAELLAMLATHESK